MATRVLSPDDKTDILYTKREVGGEVNYCGYKRDYFENLSKVEEEFICKKCQGIIREPSVSNNKVTCLICSDNPGQLSAVNLVENCINKLEIRCPLLRDCKWKGKVSEAETHLNNCSQFLIECDGCQEVVDNRDNVETHKQKICPMRKIVCSYCQNVVHAKDMGEHHNTNCPLYPTECPYGCGIELARKDMTPHKAECPLAEVECPFAKYGCRAEPMKRSELLTHSKEFVVEHMDMSKLLLENQGENLEKFKYQAKLIRSQKELLKSKEEKLKSQEKLLKGKEEKLKSQEELLKAKEIQVETEKTVSRDLRRQIETMKCLVEWNHELPKRSCQMESPPFYVQNYKIRCYCQFEPGFLSTKVKLLLERVTGEYDDILGIASIIECRLDIIEGFKFTLIKSFYLKMDRVLIIDMPNIIHTFWVYSLKISLRMYLGIKTFDT